MHPLQNRGTKEQRHDSRRQTDSNSNLALQCHPLGTDHHEMVSNCVRGFGSQCRGQRPHGTSQQVRTKFGRTWIQVAPGFKSAWALNPGPMPTQIRARRLNPLPAIHGAVHARERWVAPDNHSLSPNPVHHHSSQPMQACGRRYAPDAPGPLLMPATQQLARSLENTLQLRNSPVGSGVVHRQELDHPCIADFMRCISRLNLSAQLPPPEPCPGHRHP